MTALNLTSVKSLLDQQLNIAVWYAQYEGHNETIGYVNEKFAEIFGFSVAQILEKKRYHLVNPPDTSADTIEQYKSEDLEAISQGIFLSCRLVEPGKELVLVKLRFDQGVLGLFQIIATQSCRDTIALPELEPKFLELIQTLRPDLQV